MVAAPGRRLLSEAEGCEKGGGGDGDGVGADVARGAGKEVLRAAREAAATTTTPTALCRVGRIARKRHWRRGRAREHEARKGNCCRKLAQEEREREREREGGRAGGGREGGRYRVEDHVLP